MKKLNTFVTIISLISMSALQARPIGRLMPSVVHKNPKAQTLQKQLDKINMDRGAMRESGLSNTPAYKKLNTRHANLQKKLNLILNAQTQPVMSDPFPPVPVNDQPQVTTATLTQTSLSAEDADILAQEEMELAQKIERLQIEIGAMRESGLNPPAAQQQKLKNLQAEQQKLQAKMAKYNVMPLRSQEGFATSLMQLIRKK